MSSDILINVLTRTSKRADKFSRNINSVREQTHTNIRHIVGTDSIKSLDYIKQHIPDETDVYMYNRFDVINSDPHPLDIFNTGPYSPHNLYLNLLNNVVNDGWIMYLDDDDLFASEDSVETIVKCIESIDEHKRNDTLIYWQMMRRGREVLPPSAPNPPQYCRIGGSCMAFHHTHVKHATWDSWKCGDFRVIQSLHKNIKHKIFINKVLITVPTEGLGKV